MSKCNIVSCQATNHVSTRAQELLLRGSRQFHLETRSRLLELVAPVMGLWSRNPVDWWSPSHSKLRIDCIEIRPILRFALVQYHEFQFSASISHPLRVEPYRQLLGSSYFWSRLRTGIALPSSFCFIQLLHSLLSISFLEFRTWNF
jgi:hypothetical protein